jgi:hypothetical protein
MHYTFRNCENIAITNHECQPILAFIVEYTTDTKVWNQLLWTKVPNMQEREPPANVIGEDTAEPW